MGEGNETIDKPQGRASDHPPLREVPPDQVKEILEAHRKWVESGGKEGKRADLHGTKLRKEDLFQANLQEALLFESDLQEALLNKANLRKAVIRQSNLQKANLIKAKLQEADLFGACLQEAELLRADLQGANLAEAKLQKAKLWKAKLREADLQDADLTDATGLLAGQLAGANVSGAKLPEAIREFEGLKIVEETSRNAQKLFVSMLLGCVYSWLTIAITTDAGLLTNLASSPLPIIGTQIPIVGFYVAAPILLLSLYLYFHIYLQRLWEGLADLPAIFPDGRPLDKRADPWLLNGLVRAHFRLLRNDRPPLSRLQVGLSFLLAWWVVPFAILWFWARYLPRHDWIGTGVHIVLLVVSIGFGIMSYLLARVTLRGKKRKPFLWKKAWKDVRTYKRGAVSLGIGAIFYFLSLGVINGIPPYFDSPDLKPTDVRAWVPRVFVHIRYPFANLAEEDVSIKPPNWTGQKEKENEEIVLVKGARLLARNLRYARAYRAFLVNADLRWANLQGANLENASLQGANLTNADLRGGANLTLANLQGGNLLGANLENASLQGANLWGANLQGANLRRANLTGADLTNATGLTQEQIESAVTDEKIRLPDYLQAPGKRSRKVP